MFNKHIGTLLIILILVLSVPSLAYGLGMENPADQASVKTKFEWIFPEVSLQAENNLLNIEFLNADMTTDSAKNYFLGRMENHVLKLNTQLDLGTQMTFGKFKLHTGLWGGSSFNVMNGFTDLLFYGYEPSKTYNLTGTRGDGLLALSVDLSYALNIPLETNDLQIGATFRLLEGLAMFCGEVTDGSVTSNQWGQAHYKFNVISYQTPMDNGEINGFQGQGFLIDLGANYILDQWKFGAVLKNLGPEMNWDNVDIVTDQYEGDFTGMDSTVEPTSSETNSHNSYKVRIPVVLEAGTTYAFGKGLSVNASLGKAFADGWGYSSTLRLTGGADWKPLKFLHLAGQISYQGTQIGVDTLTELRIYALWIDFQLGWTGSVLPDNNTSGVRVLLSSRLNF